MLKDKRLTRNVLVTLLALISPMGAAEEGSFDEQQILVDEQALNSSLFGISVALDEETLVVGARADDAACNPGVNCNAGAALVFERDSDGIWGMAQKLIASDASGDDLFGNSVSVDGDFLAVGALRADTNCSSGVCDNGAVYVFERGSDGFWQEIQKLTLRDPTDFDAFGSSVFLQGNDLVVGAPLHNSVTLASGAVYVYRRLDSGTWVEVRKLFPNNARQSDFFGTSVSMEGDTLAVGLDSDRNPGGVDIFERNTLGIWLHQQRLTPSTIARDEQFGESISLNGDVLAVGARLDEPDPTCPVSDFCDNGVVYVYERDVTGSWNEVQSLMASDAGRSDEFGKSVAVQGDVLVVGSYFDDDACPESPNTIPNPCDSGSAYIFQRSPEGVWQEVQKITASDANTRDLFGDAVALDGNTLVVGGRNAHAAYVFTSPETPPAPIPNLTIPGDISASYLVPVEVPIHLETQGHDLSSTVFSIDFDQTCLSFDPTDGDGDGIPDAITFLIPVDLTAAASFVANGGIGEIDVTVADYSVPLSTLPSGTLATVRFTPTCLPASMHIDAPIAFSTNPVPLFGDILGMEVIGEGVGGSIAILPGNPGDCNNDGVLGGGDITACVLEVFDGDGQSWTDVASGSFLGNPVGCDSNQDLVVDAGDFACKSLLIFGGTCAPPSRRGTQSPVEIRLGQAIGIAAGEQVEIQMTFVGHGQGVTSGAFSVDYDDGCLALEPTNGVSFTLPPGIEPSVSSEPGHLAISLLDPVPPLAPMTEGALAKLTFTTLCDPSEGSVEAVVRFGSTPPPSFGNTFGQSVPGVGVDGGVSLVTAFFADGFDSGGTGAWSVTQP